GTKRFMPRIRRSGSHCESERPWPGAIRTIFHNTVTSATRLFKSIALDTNDSCSFTFTEPGTYEYFCSLHPRMTGTIVVELPRARGQDLVAVEQHRRCYLRIL